MGVRGGRDWLSLGTAVCADPVGFPWSAGHPARRPVSVCLRSSNRSGSLQASKYSCVFTAWIRGKPAVKPPPPAVSGVEVAVEARLCQRFPSTRSATRSAMASDAVRPGESMPAACTSRGCRWSRRIREVRERPFARRAARPDATVAGAELIQREAGHQTPRRRVEPGERLAARFVVLARLVAGGGSQRHAAPRWSGSGACRGRGRSGRAADGPGRSPDAAPPAAARRTRRAPGGS